MNVIIITRQFFQKINFKSGFYNNNKNNKIPFLIKFMFPLLKMFVYVNHGISPSQKVYPKPIQEKKRCYFSLVMISTV